MSEENPWISVEDEMPKEFDRQEIYQIKTDKGIIYTGNYNGYFCFCVFVVESSLSYLFTKEINDARYKNNPDGTLSLSFSQLSIKNYGKVTHWRAWKPELCGVP